MGRRTHRRGVVGADGSLGYERYGAQGGDWGTFVTTTIAQQDPEHVVGIHAAPIANLRPSPGRLTPAEASALKRAPSTPRGHRVLHPTADAHRPRLRLADSPAAQCAWIVEKFWAWTDNNGHPEDAVSRDDLLDNVMLYWLPNNGTSSARLYWESLRNRNTEPVTVPTGCSVFPKEIVRFSRRWAETRFTDIRFWNEPERGGHFAAFEEPDLFVADVQASFRTMR
jgi:pimeloyl-ACP methyl ester carboxylesterase